MFVPWLSALTRAWAMLLVSVISMALAVVSGYLGWYSIITTALLVVGYLALIGCVLNFLNLSRAFSGRALLLLLLLVASTISAFALHYRSSGLLDGGDEFDPDLWDALYFSVTTFTTLGYGDLQPLPEHRLTTSLEVLLGLLFMATLVSFVWFRFSENLVPKDMTFLEGKRISKTLLIPERMQVRTLAGKDLKSKKYEDFTEGVPYYYDVEYEDWTPVSDPEDLSDDAIVIMREKRKFSVSVPGLRKKPDRDS